MWNGFYWRHGSSCGSHLPGVQLDPCYPDSSYNDKLKSLQSITAYMMRVSFTGIPPCSGDQHGSIPAPNKPSWQIHIKGIWNGLHWCFSRDVARKALSEHPASGFGQQKDSFSFTLTRCRVVGLKVRFLLSLAEHSPWFSPRRSPPASPWSPLRSWPLFSRGTSLRRSGRSGRSCRRPNLRWRWFWRCESSEEEASSLWEKRRILLTSRYPPYHKSRVGNEQGTPGPAAAHRGGSSNEVSF